MTDGYIATLAHYKLETPITIASDIPQLLIVENPREFFAIVTEMLRQCDGGEGNFVFLHNDSLLAPEKCVDMIVDPFSLRFQDKKVGGMLGRKLEILAQDAELQMHYHRLNTEMHMYYSALLERLDVPLMFDDADIAGILKAGKVRIREEYTDLSEKLICYINTMIQLKNSCIFVFVHLKSVLSDSELLQLYKHCALEKVGLLLLESSVGRGVLSAEQAVIITDDLCELVDNKNESVVL